MAKMKFASATTCRSEASFAVGELVDQIQLALGGLEPDFLLLFCTPHYEDDVPDVMDTLSTRFPSATLVGCGAEGTIGNGKELQRSCSMALLAGHMPRVHLHPFHISRDQMEQAGDDWPLLIGMVGDLPAMLLGLGDPFSFDIRAFLETINERLPRVPVVGGMASAGERPGQNRLILDDNLYTSGLVGLAMYGDVSVRTVVSQGCRPIGKPFVITKGDRNIIAELGGRPAFTQFQELTKDLSKEDIALARQALLLGGVIDEYKSEFDRGDFLIHNILGVDPNSGAMAIAAPVKVGTTVQFHVRDAVCADEDLRSLLTQAAPSNGAAPPAAAMLFSCNGRGLRMWPQEGHDVSLLNEIIGDIPVAGFFAAGELGPIGEKNFIHGFTASIALLEQSHS